MELGANIIVGSDNRKIKSTVSGFCKYSHLLKNRIIKILGKKY